MDPFEGATGATAVGNHSSHHHHHHDSSCCSHDDVVVVATDNVGVGNKRKKKVFLAQSHPRNKAALFAFCKSWLWILLSIALLILLLGGWSLHFIKAWKLHQDELVEIQVQHRMAPLTQDFEFRLQKEKHDYELALQKARDEFQDALQKEKLTYERNLKAAQEAAAAAQIDNSDHTTQQEEEDAAALQSVTEKVREMEHAVSNLELHVESLKSYKEKMHKAIQHMSRTIALEKFGPGPYRVELTLAFDPADPGKGDAHRIVLELAPLDDMPHTVFWFLSQVSLGLWNGCSFHRNADHVIQSGPTRNFQTPAAGAGLAQKFIDAGYESVLFQEYSPTFPHKILTVGYAGRPGGPDFYISTQDNTLNHGPGGQGDYDDPGEADPCFAKVVEGEDAVWRMHALSTEHDDYQGLVHNVAIVQIKLLPSTSPSLDQ